MKTSLAPALALLGLLAGCSTVTPHYDARYGDAVRNARHSMAIDPEAGKKPDPVVGLDGKAARESMNRYEHSFKQPPPVVNVINIGGSIGGGGR
jgi:hypothetical protein